MAEKVTSAICVNAVFNEKYQNDYRLAEAW